MSKLIQIREHKAKDFINVDHGKSVITITFFKGMEALTPGWANQEELTPDQAEELANDLLRRANLIRGGKEIK